MTDIRTARLQLHAIDVAEGERIVARSAGPDDSWATDFPFEGDVMAVGSFLRATAATGEQRPFGFYLITRLADGQAIGGIGFKGQPDRGVGGGGEGGGSEGGGGGGGSREGGGRDRSRVEIGYGLVPSARGNGYAAEAVLALLAVATEHRVSTVIADTTLDNIASQRTLVRAGFRLVATDDALHHYQAILER